MVTFRISWISSTVKAGFEIAPVQPPKGGFFLPKLGSGEQWNSKPT
ncbi:Unknown protein sequence [Pseudomonas syringae pv. maculicola]|nr:Unknown protein sequence [Pseudomonas syringae pv. maculicola]